MGAAPSQGRKLLSLSGRNRRTGHDFRFGRYTPGGFGSFFARRITLLLKQLYAQSTNLRLTGSAASCRIKICLTAIRVR
jgi:hypothetical protein